MIAYLQGSVKTYADYIIVITSGGVGYKVFAGNRALSQIKDGQIQLFTYAHIREDRQELYGLASESDLQLFEMLLSVSGCGPKMALTLTDAGAARIIEAIQQADVTYFTSFPRVGKKLAQKLIIELKNKLGGLTELDLAPKSETYEDALAGLLTLGFDEPNVRKVPNDLDLANMDAAAAIKAALGKLKK